METRQVSSRTTFEGVKASSHFFTSCQNIFNISNMLTVGSHHFIFRHYITVLEVFLVLLSPAATLPEKAKHAVEPIHVWHITVNLPCINDRRNIKHDAMLYHTSVSSYYTELSCVFSLLCTIGVKTCIGPSKNNRNQCLAFSLVIHSM